MHHSSSNQSFLQFCLRQEGDRDVLELELKLEIRIRESREAAWEGGFFWYVVS